MNFKSLSLLAFFAASPAFALPGMVDCSRDLRDGSRIVQDFEFRPLAHRPGAYQVHVWIAKAPPFQGDPNQTVSSDDPDVGSHWQVQTNATYLGHVPASDPDVIYFDGNQGFFRLGEGQATLQLPGQRLPQLLENCVEPEPGITVHD